MGKLAIGFFIISVYVMIWAPEYELVELISKSLFELLGIQLLLESRIKTLPWWWVRVWPLHGMTIFYFAIVAPVYYLLPNSRWIIHVIVEMCLCVVMLWHIITDHERVPEISASSEDSEGLSSHNDEKGEISV